MVSWAVSQGDQVFHFNLFFFLHLGTYWHYLFTSLSAPDRDSLSQQRQQNNNRNSMYEDGAASQHAAIPSASMEVDEQLEQELGGKMHITYSNY
jgi:hypothetical protein